MPPLIRVEEGDISSFDGDAVVNAANNHLIMGSGVAGALGRRGGPTIQADCQERVHSKGPLELGEAAVTGSGDLPCGIVIHAAAMGDQPPTAETIRTATRNALRLALEQGVQSIAFPVLGSGVGGFPFDQAARLMLEEINDHGATFTMPASVVIYGFTPEQAQALRRIVGPSF
ncbi:MAG TPA: macro domain-containing protein [Longimicrobiales bacterium]|jgi:O-acetyl-ADP-ribose deacetylase (regulator of RNase III)